MVGEEDIAAIRAAFEQGGEFSAAIELRRRFPFIEDNNQARAHARTIATWRPIAVTGSVSAASVGRRSRKRQT